MSEASLAVQKLIISRLKAHSPLLALVPGSAIFDRNERPEAFPCVLLGEAQTVGDDIDCGALSDVYSTIHVWTQETGTRDCKMIAGAIRRALWQAAADDVDGFRIEATIFEDARFLRDSSGEHAHGVVTVKSMVSGD